VTARKNSGGIGSVKKWNKGNKWWHFLPIPLRRRQQSRQ